MSATPKTVDFTNAGDMTYKPSGITREKDNRPLTADGKLLTPKQIRARARRKRNRNHTMTEQELDYLYNKPVEEWDLQELAHGRPRNSKGHFSGPKPDWVDRAVFEKAMQQYVGAVKTHMKSTTVDALSVLRELLADDTVDEKGKPIVPASTKVDISKFLIEHVVGKPTQRIENDVSVKLQGILGTVMMNPAENATGNYLPGHFPGVTMALASGDEDEFDGKE